MRANLIPIDVPVEIQCNECPVRKMALFKRVPEAQLSWTQDYRSAQYRLGARQHLYHEGEGHEFVYTLYEGCVKLYKTLDNGKIQAMRYALPGDFLGFQGDMSAAMHHGAQALTDCILCAFPKEKVNRMLCEHPEIASEMIMKNAQIMAVCQEHLLSTGARKARERIAFTLFELHTRMEQIKTFLPERFPDETLSLPLTQDDLAEAAGLTNIHVNRTLKGMKEERLIDCGKGKITVLNAPALQQISGFNTDLLDMSKFF